MWRQALSTGSIQSHSLKRAVLASALLGLYAGLVQYVEHAASLRTWLETGFGFRGQLGVVLGALLALRMNAAYARWWEGRTLWGAIVNDGRALTLKVCHATGVDTGECEWMVRHLISWAWNVLSHLRQQPPVAKLNVEIPSPPPAHIPNYLVTLMYQRLGRWKQSGQIDGFEYRAVDDCLHSLVRSLGGCERMARTPMVPSYVRFLRATLALFFLALPLDIELGPVAIVMMMLAAFLMFGMEYVAENIEHPFGTTDDDLPLSALLNGFEKAVLDIHTTNKETVPC